MTGVAGGGRARSPDATSTPSKARSTSPGKSWPWACEMGCTLRTSTPFWSSPILKCFLQPGRSGAGGGCTNAAWKQANVPAHVHYQQGTVMPEAGPHGQRLSKGGTRERAAAKRGCGEKACRSRLQRCATCGTSQEAPARSGEPPGHGPGAPAAAHLSAADSMRCHCTPSAGKPVKQPLRW